MHEKIKRIREVFASITIEDGLEIVIAYRDAGSNEPTAIDIGAKGTPEFLRLAAGGVAEAYKKGKHKNATDRKDIN